ncbi:hypothetical protein [Paenibacillus daejeonensis]|uniref:hypothetical protein n=1 Tax=Paenibacillus daejeonensis TaxID=135193 RepID=UPI00037696EA|nr:hypothetical protein [Paenibacillus daejeonensis]
MIRPINLLPRKPFYVRYRLHLQVGIGLLTVLLLAWQGVLLHTWSSEREGTVRQLAALAEERATLESQLLALPPAQEQADLTAMLGRLESGRQDWLSVLAPLIEPLPADAMITNMGINEAGELSAEYEFDNEQAALAFVRSVEQVPLFSQVYVSTLKPDTSRQVTPAGGGESVQVIRLILSMMLADPTTGE